MSYNLELVLLKVLLEKEKWSNYKGVIDLKSLKDAYNEIYYLYIVLDKLHAEAKGDLTLDEFYAYFYATYPDSSREKYDPLFESIAESEVSPDAGEAILKQIKQRDTLLKLSEKAYDVSQGRGSVEDVRELLLKVDQGTEESGESESFVTDDLETLVASAIQKQGLRWRLQFLNKAIGSLRQGDFGFIFARPETGKTTFLASEVSHMLTQTDKPIIWFNNEEQGEKVMLRVYQAFFGCTVHDLIANSKRYKEEFRRLVGGRFRLVDNATTDKRNAEKIIEKVKPGLILWDQIDKIKGFAADRDDLVYGAIYQWARELAKAYAPSIGVCQAGGTAEGVQWLTMDHVANAKTSKQAEADFIVGIGKSHSQGTEFIRFLNISKNKLIGDEDSIPTMRHGRSEVLIQPEVARYRDLINYE